MTNIVYCIFNRLLDYKVFYSFDWQKERGIGLNTREQEKATYLKSMFVGNRPGLPEVHHGSSYDEYDRFSLAGCHLHYYMIWSWVHV